MNELSLNELKVHLVCTLTIYLYFWFDDGCQNTVVAGKL